MGTRKYQHYYLNSLWETVKIAVIHFGLFSPVLSMILLFPKKYHWYVTILGRGTVPLILGCFYLFGVSTFLSLKWGLCNNKVT
jgi:hypothetical protein